MNIKNIFTVLGKKKRTNFNKPPILIGGCGRSGTTLLLSVLSAHPGIFAIDRETRAFCNWESKDEQSTPRPTKLYRFYRYLLFHKIPPECTRWCEKSPENIRYIPQINNFFNSQVFFIHIIRDGRDVVTSRHPRNPDKYWVSPKRWVEDVRFGLFYKDWSNVITVKYEDLIFNNQKVIEDICEKFNIEYREELKDWESYSKVKEHKALYSKVKSISRNSVGRWKRKKYSQRIEEVLAYSGFEELLKELGYL